MNDYDMESLEALRMCPRCYQNHRAYSFYSVCPFCSTTGKHPSIVIGDSWRSSLVTMLTRTETTLGRGNRLGKALRGEE